MNFVRAAFLRIKFLCSENGIFALEKMTGFFFIKISAAIDKYKNRQYNACIGNILPILGGINMYDFENMDEKLIAYVNIFICANRLQAIMDSGLEDITTKQWLALTMIDAFPEPPTLKEISELSGVTHQSMRQIVDRLIDKGLLQIVPDKKDKRAIRLVKTETADNIRSRDLDRNWGFVFELFSCLEEKEAMIFCSALEKLCNKLNELKENKK